ncbi:MAG: hypothetical protein LBD55_02785 [Treponema sp.]|nr:hypothetical protein [Treponema sp.]
MEALRKKRLETQDFFIPKGVLYYKADPVFQRIPPKPLERRAIAHRLLKSRSSSNF